MHRSMCPTQFRKLRFAVQVGFTEAIWPDGFDGKVDATANTKKRSYFRRCGPTSQERARSELTWSGTTDSTRDFILRTMDPCVRLMKPASQEGEMCEK